MDETNMEYNPFSRNFIKHILQENNLWLSKNRGQNYLFDRNIAQKIVALVPKDLPVLEVGSGLGALTTLLIEHPAVYAVEIDRGIHSLLISLLSAPELHLIHADFLTFDIDSLPHDELLFVSNLPYSISGEAVKRFIASPRLKQAVLMLQKEFVDRMNAPVGSEFYSGFSVLSQTYLNIQMRFKVTRGCFFPEPGVDSAVVTMTKKEVATPQDEFREFLLKGFAAKRKTIYNNLKPLGFTEEDIEKCGSDPRVRPQTISPSLWVVFFDYYVSKLS